MTLDEIKKSKIKLGLTNAELSKISGVPLGTLSKILSGETKNPGHDTVMAIENALSSLSSVKGNSAQSVPEKTSYIQNSYNAQAHEITEFREETIYNTSPKKDTPREGSYTTDDYFALPEDHRAELIDGTLYDLATPLIRHQRIIGELFIQFHTYIQNNDGNCEVLFSPVAVRLDKDNKTMLEPDLVIVCDPEKQINDKYIEGAPDFVCEVVSPSSKSRDYIKKMAKYMNAGVKEYWIIDPEQQRVTVYTDYNEGCPYMHSLEGELEVHIYDGKLKIDLGKLKKYC